MNRITVIGIGLGVFVAGGVVYAILQVVGVDSLTAGVWSQALLVGGLVGWLVTYLTRVMRQDMTYHQQRQNYEEAFLQKQLEELTPEELAKLQAEIEQENQSRDPSSKV